MVKNRRRFSDKAFEKIDFRVCGLNRDHTVGLELKIYKKPLNKKIIPELQCQ